jgi:hypothetical protein
MLTLTLSATLLAVLPQAAQPPAGGARTELVAAQEGAGILGKIACAACGIAIVGAGGATFGGIAVGALFWGDVYVACALVCIMAF